MTRQFIAFAAQVAIITGAIVGILRLLDVDPYYMKLVIAVGVGVLALSALVVALSNLPLRRGEAKADDGARAARAAQRARARELARRFDAFLRDLRRAQPWFRLWYRERAGAPWWLVLGPAGHGKSTLLLAAADAREHAPLAAHVATREPRFFTAPGLAFVELPDDFMDHPGAARMLRRLARKRPRQPVAGLLVVARLDHPDPELFVRTRGHIQRLAGELAIRPPVVIAWTHLDRLAGFAEFCDGLDTLERPLGVTLPACDSPQAVAHALQSSLRGPLDWIRQRCHALVARPRPSSQQAHLYSFWQRFEDLAARAGACVGALAAHPLPGGESLRPRGVYFLAATAGVAPPEDDWLALLARRADGALPADTAAPAALAPPQAFVRGLFRTELLRDGPLAARLRLFRWRRASVHALTAGAAASFAVCTTVTVSDAARLQLEHMQGTWDAASEAFAGDDERSLLPSPALDRLRQAVEHWRAAPSGELWGLHRGDLLADAAAAAFTRAVCRGVLRPIARRSEQSLQRFVNLHAGDSVPNPDEHRAILDDLHLYTLLAAPDDRHWPWTGDEFSWLSGHVERAWGEDDPGSEATRLAVLKTFAAVVRRSAAPAPAGVDACTHTGGALAANYRDELAAGTSRILALLPSERRTIERIIDGINRDRGLDSVDLTGTKLQAGTPVRPAFTREGWDRAGEAILREVERHHNDQWFLRDQRAAQNRRDHCLKLRDAYVARYLDTWRDAVQSLKILKSNSFDELEDKLRDLRDKAPLTRAFRLVDRHTQHLPAIRCPTAAGDRSAWLTDLKARLDPAEPQPSTATGLGQRDARDVADTFARFVDYGVVAGASPGEKSGDPRAAPLDTYHQHLAVLGKELQQARQNEERMPELTKAARNAHDEIVRQIDHGEFGSWEERLQELLLPPLKDLMFLSDADGAGQLNKTWCTAVVEPLRGGLLRNYPFDPEARQQAVVAEVSRMFHPTTGDIAKFRDAHLSGFVETGVTSVTERPLGVDAERRLNPSVVAFLDDAYKLGVLLHPAEAAGLDLTVRMTCQRRINKLILTVDGAEHPHDCSIQKARSVHWPGEKDPGARLVAHGLDGANDLLLNAGAFGLFKLLERGVPRRIEGRHTFVATFHFGKFGALELTFQPQPILGGSLLYGFGADTRFLAPMRTHALRNPPEALFREYPYDCARGAGP